MGGIARAVGIAPSKKSSASQAATAMSTGAARDTDLDAEAVVETDSGMMGRKKKGKRALIAQTAAANVGGDGGSGLNIPIG